MVDGDNFDASDLMVVLGGGSVSSAPTRERVNKTIELYKQHPDNILICAYRNNKQDIINYLVLNEIKPKHITKSFYEYDGKEGGGTYNNVLEIISVIKDNDFQDIVIVTSPYHELRVSLIFSSLIKEAGINGIVNIKYSHIKNSEVLYTDMPRFIGIISHELLGIIGFYIQHVGSKLVEYIL